MKQIIQTILEYFSAADLEKKIKEKKEQENTPLGLFFEKQETLLDIFSIEELEYLFNLKRK